MGLEHIRTEIEQLRLQIRKQQKDILSLRKAGIDANAAVALLERMQNKVDQLCEERERLVGEERVKRRTYASGKAIRGVPATRRA